MKQIYYIFILSFLAMSPMQSSFAASAAAAAGSGEDPRIAALATMSLHDIHAEIQAVLAGTTPANDAYAYALQEALPGAMKREATYIKESKGKLWDEAVKKTEGTQLLSATMVGVSTYMDSVQEEVQAGIKTSSEIFNLIQRELEATRHYVPVWQATTDAISKQVLQYTSGASFSKDIMGDLKWSVARLEHTLAQWGHDAPNLFSNYSIQRTYQEYLSVLEDIVQMVAPFMPAAYQADSNTIRYTGAATASALTVTRVAGTNDLAVMGNALGIIIPFQSGMRAAIQPQFPEGDADKPESTNYNFTYTLPSGFTGKLGTLSKAEAELLVGVFNKQIGVIAKEIERQRVAVAAAEAEALAADFEATFGDSPAAGKGSGGKGKKAGKTKAAAVTVVASVSGPAPALKDSSTAGKGSAGKTKAAAVTVVASASVSAPALKDSSTAAAFGRAGGVAAAVSVPAGVGSMPVASAMDAERALFAARAADKKRLTEITLALWAAQDDAPALGVARPVASRVGLKARQKVSLATLLGVRIGGQIHDINTLDWDKLVYLLKGLGFHQTDRDKFQNAEKQSINLHAIHYDDYRLNHAAKKIVLTQLENYGLTVPVLQANLA